MTRKCEATEEDWALVRRLWEEEHASWAACRRAIDGRASEPTLKRRGDAEGWTRKSTGLKTSPSIEQRRAVTAHAMEANRLRWAQEKDRVLSKLIATTDHLLDRIVRPHTLIEVKTVSGGKDMGGSVEVVEVPLSEPLPGDQQRLMTSAAIAIDKIQLLAGEATSRNEQIAAGDRGAAVARAKELRDEVAARREQRAAAAETG